MKKLMLSVAVFMMGVSTLGLYAQDSNVEPVKKDSVPTEEPKKEEPKSEAAWVCMSEEPAKTDSVPSQGPKKDVAVKYSSACAKRNKAMHKWRRS